ncbi:angiotensin-converting enzyme-like [Neocloeon triangulifer]|uniref:angiotensin-converting enzyme-like n=1 Tax=Neocloeon triangulifer TaxID=2078957 RepID=UPI00286ECE65|nr:angiotensin-converting enzyme-like [Neocloeon triangulifer]
MAARALLLLALVLATEAAVPRVMKIKPLGRAPKSLTRDLRVPGPEEQALTEHLTGPYETEATSLCNQFVLADWGYSTDINNPAAEEALLNETLRFAAFSQQQWETYFRDANWETYEQADVKRQAMFLSVLGTAALDPVALEQYNKEITTMTGIYGAARICPYTNQNCDIATEGIRLEPDMETVISGSRDYEELKYVWSQWRDASGAKMRTNYQNYVTLSNQAAQANGYADMGEMWRADFETPNFQADIQRLWLEVKPLYDRLHTYALAKLREVYGAQIPDGPFIPAHILGNMWAQSWDNIYDILEPFPNATKIDITQAMIDQGYDVPRMFAVANEFYTSLGLEPMEMSYGDLAIIEQPDDRDIVCHASAWDFCDGQDFRIKMCTNVDEEDFITVHHELGHIEYFILYKDQPITFRKGANPGFHEAVGDVIALSVKNPQHYATIGLLPEYTDSYENSINTLLRFALSKVAFLPFAVLIDSWRWEVFSGATPEANWNTRWWQLREELQLVSAPVPRTEQHFDPGAKFHVPGNSQYISYFIAHILQFQLHRALCIEAGQYDPANPDVKPLHTCDIYRSTAAGTRLRNGLALGGSLLWTETLQQLTGETQLSGTALLEYFKPLFDFLEPVPEVSQPQPLVGAQEDPPTEPVDQTVPIVVGAVLGAVVVIALVAYFVNQYRNRNKD